MKTPWFNGAEKPVRVGVYETSIEHHRGRSTYQYWNGSYWGGYCWNINDVPFVNTQVASAYQNPRWRGFMEKQT